MGTKCTKSGQNFFFIFWKECKSTSNRGRCMTVFKFHQFDLPFEKQIIPYFHFLMYRSYFVCHCILYFLSLIMLDDFFILSTFRPITPQQHFLVHCSFPKATATQVLLKCSKSHAMAPSHFKNSLFQ